MEIKLSVKGMTCEMCVKHVREGLQKLDGVESAEVDLENATAQVRGKNLDQQKLIKAVEEEGYEAAVLAA